MTKQEKRLYIREVAKDIAVRKFSTHAEAFEVSCKGILESASFLADELESFERKQDEEEDFKRYCFGVGQEDSMMLAHCCTDCTVKSQCQENRGSK